MTTQVTSEGVAPGVNQQWWDERAGLHMDSEFYDIQRVIYGEVRLHDYEIEEVGPVEGKNLVHLQCHLGTETIGWARLGAKATGLDFSQEVVNNARKLAQASGVDVRYVQGDVYDAPELLGEGVADVVYVNIGSLHWLSDIAKWGRTVSGLLAPQGRLYVNEIHPVASVLAEETPTFERDYFDERPVVWDEDGSYADTQDPTQHNKHVIYDRPLSSIIGAVINAGLVITSFKERPGQEYQQFPYQVQGEDGRWYSPEGYGAHPSTFSLTATKPELTASARTE